MVELAEGKCNTLAGADFKKIINSFEENRNKKNTIESFRSTVIKWAELIVKKIILRYKP
jgi:hypothetical protein